MTNKDDNKWQRFNENEPGFGESEAEISKEEVDTEELEFTTRQQLENQLTLMERQAQEYKEKAVRVQAEMENLRKRTERDISNAIKFGTEKLICDLLPIVDSIVRGLDNPESHDSHVKSMREGMSLTLDLLHKTLTKHGVQIIDPAVGDAFNPTLHEAVSMQQDPKAKPNSILKVIQKGYQLNDRVLRAAIVIVAA